MCLLMWHSVIHFAQLVRPMFSLDTRQHIQQSWNTVLACILCAWLHSKHCITRLGVYTHFRISDASAKYVWVKPYPQWKFSNTTIEHSYYVLKIDMEFLLTYMNTSGRRTERFVGEDVWVVIIILSLQTFPNWQGHHPYCSFTKVKMWYKHTCSSIVYSDIILVSCHT